MNRDVLMQHYFELSLALDKFSVRKDYEALRILHYANIEWMKEHNLAQGYYKTFYEDLKESRREK